MKWTRKQLRVLAEHPDCTPQILPSGPHWGLYCREHGVWIRWVAHQDREKILNFLAHDK